MAKSKFCEKLSLYVWFIPYLVLFNYTYRYFKEHQSLPSPAFYETTPTIDTVSPGFVHVSAYPLLQTAGKPCHSPDVPLSDSFFSTDRKNVSTSFLCKLNMVAYCGSIEPSEVVDGFWVVCPAYASFQTFIQYRYILHENYKGYIESFGLPFSTIEAIRKDRNQEYLLTKPGNEPYDIQIEFWDDMYIRENFLNVAARKIPNWDYFAWIDTHQVFENVYWWEESIVRMERNASVQLFQYLKNRDLQNVTGPKMLSSIQVSLLQSSFEPAPHFLLGNAFAIRKDLYDQIEYIYDECVASCCDCAWVLASAPKSYAFSYFASFYRYSNQMHKWINRTQDIFKGSRAIVRGTLDHLFHETNFNYVPMIWKIHDSGFNLTEGLIRDANFTLRIKDENIKKIFEKDTFMTNLKFYVKGNNIDFYAKFVGSMLLSLILTWCVSRRAKKVSQNSN